MSAVVTAAGLAGAAVLALGSGPGVDVRRRLDAAVGSPGQRAAYAGLIGGRAAAGSPGTAIVVGAAGLICASLAGLSPPFTALLLASGWSLWWFAGRRALVALRRDNRAIERDLPAAADLLAACLAGGASPSEALDLVATVSPDPLSGRLRSAAASMRLGADTVQAWGPVAPDEPLGPLTRAFARSMTTGAPLATTVAMLAAELRRDRRFAAEAAARRAGVLAVGPLMVCFLPAFVLIGVVPVVVGVATSVLGDLAVTRPHP